jgi:lipopolysaccharide/colanic/teichoic acid biosynthesis glycosyltransferase
MLDSRGGILFRQKRVGKGNKDFTLYKFRTMNQGAEKKGLLTIGNKEKRITNTGYYLRKYKLDELPQLFNVLKGDMSLVGPRPEVRKYVNIYDESQMQILDIRPGVTDIASLVYFNENEILDSVDDPERYYIEKIIPHKIQLNMQYRNNRRLSNYFQIIFKTLFKVFH